MNELIDLVKPKILDYCGINLAASQQQDLITYLEKTAAAKGMTAADYCRSLTPYTPAFDDLINQITVNETYFFREELQFECLEKEIFPIFRKRKGRDSQNTFTGMKSSLRSVCSSREAIHPAL